MELRASVTIAHDGTVAELLFNLGLRHLDHLVALGSIGTLMYGAYGTRILCHGDSSLHFFAAKDYTRTAVRGQGALQRMIKSEIPAYFRMFKQI